MPRIARSCQSTLQISAERQCAAQRRGPSPVANGNSGEVGGILSNPAQTDGAFSLPGESFHCFAVRRCVIDRSMTAAAHRHVPSQSQTTNPQGAGQLSLIEHALCPLAVQPVAASGWVHESQYRYTDQAGQRRTALVRVICPLGLTPTDEFYLWGLLALTLSQREPAAEFHATPHYCLRQLGIIDQHARRGGRQYAQFIQSLERLSTATYQNDGFYDPLRCEHRRVAFGFLSYSLPLSAESSRAWRIVWDGVFMELAGAVGGHLWFDLAIYRQLDAASRRLFLFVSKLFRRMRQTPLLELRHLGEHVLGFAPSLATRDLKVKVKRCVQRLAEHGVVTLTEGLSPIRPARNGTEVVQLTRGPYFDRRRRSSPAQPLVESPLAELMREIGLDDRAIQRCLSRYRADLLQQWLDITLAARERYGESFFRKSAAAYFVDNVRNVAQGNRTPPDWWHDLVREERRTQAEIGRQKRPSAAGRTSGDPTGDLVEAMARQFQAAGQSAAAAAANARRFVDCCGQQSETFAPASLLKILT